MLVSILVGIASLTWLDGDLQTVVNWIAIAGIVISAILLVSRYIQWFTTNFVITSDRIIFRTGVFAKHGIEIPLERVNTVFFNQTFFERLLGAGDVSIESGGETGKQTFSDIRKPSAVQNEIYRQMELNNTRMYGGGRTAEPAAPAPAAPAPNIPEQIAQLDALRQQGVLSEAEFADKKAELLRRM